jgi:hypothetical protein
MSRTTIDELSDSELSRNLAYSGLLLIAHELIKNLVIDPVKAFYRNTTFAKGMPFTTYEKDVLSRHTNKFDATLLYLRDHFEAISDDDVKAISLVGEGRQSLAHELSEELINLDPAKDEAILGSARDALFRLSNFWAYIAIGADPEFASLEIDWSTAHGRDLTLLDTLIERTRRTRLSQ